MPKWNEKLETLIREALKAKGATRCPMCGSEDLELLPRFFAEWKDFVGWQWNLLYARTTYGIDLDRLHAQVECKNCGYVMRHLLSRLLPPEAIRSSQIRS